MPALTLYALASLPSVALTGMTEGTHYLRVNSAHPLRVRLQAAGDAGFYGSVRPYYRFANAWVPLRGDGDDSVTSAPCTAQSDKLNGWGDRIFESSGLSAPVILVKEDGNGVGVSGLTAYLDIADSKG